MRRAVNAYENAPKSHTYAIIKSSSSLSLHSSSPIGGISLSGLDVISSAYSSSRTSLYPQYFADALPTVFIFSM